jgi:hypothetical protein
MPPEQRSGGIDLSQAGDPAPCPATRVRAHRAARHLFGALPAERTRRQCPVHRARLEHRAVPVVLVGELLRAARLEHAGPWLDSLVEVPGDRGDWVQSEAPTDERVGQAGTREQGGRMQRTARGHHRAGPHGRNQAPQRRRIGRPSARRRLVRSGSAADGRPPEPVRKPLGLCRDQFVGHPPGLVEGTLPGVWDSVEDRLGCAFEGLEGAQHRWSTSGSLPSRCQGVLKREPHAQPDMQPVCEREGMERETGLEPATFSLEDRSCSQRKVRKPRSTASDWSTMPRSVLSHVREAG